MKNLVKSVIAGSMVVASLAAVSVNADVCDNGMYFTRTGNNGEIYTFIENNNGSKVRNLEVTCADGYHLELDTEKCGLDYKNAFVVICDDTKTVVEYIQLSGNKQTFTASVESAQYKDGQSFTYTTEGATIGGFLTINK